MPDELARRCTDCGQIDGHPRHTVVFVDPTNAAGVSEAGHHFDCGLNRTQSCSHCTEALQGWQGGTGELMSNHLTKPKENA